MIPITVGVRRSTGCCGTHEAWRTVSKSALTAACSNRVTVPYELLFENERLYMDTTVSLTCYIQRERHVMMASDKVTPCLQVPSSADTRLHRSIPSLLKNHSSWPSLFVSSCCSLLRIARVVQNRAYEHPSLFSQDGHY